MLTPEIEAGRKEDGQDENGCGHFPPTSTCDGYDLLFARGKISVRRKEPGVQEIRRQEQEKYSRGLHNFILTGAGC